KRDHRTMIIIGMQNVRNKVNLFHQLNHSHLEKSKAFAIIVIPIQFFSIEIIKIIDEIVSDPFKIQALDTTILFAPAHFNRKIKKMLTLLLILFSHACKKR